ncbi:MAG: hypothetical protein V8Q42_00970 [Anaerovoracaceae bacterium]
MSQSAYNEHKLSWNINSKADGYEIYRSQTAGDRGSVAATVKDRNKLSVTVSTTPGTTYYYTVRPYILVDGSPAGDLYSEQVSGKTSLQAPTLKAASASYSSVKLTWSKVAGAQGYKVYRYSSKTKKYELVKTITRSDTVSYTNTGRTTGTKYSYKDDVRKRKIRKQPVKDCFSDADTFHADVIQGEGRKEVSCSILEEGFRCKRICGVPFD